MSLLDRITVFGSAATIIGVVIALGMFLGSDNAELRADVRDLRIGVQHIDQRLSRIEGHLLGLESAVPPETG